MPDAFQKYRKPSHTGDSNFGAAFAKLCGLCHAEAEGQTMIKSMEDIADQERMWRSKEELRADFVKWLREMRERYGKEWDTEERK